LRKGSLTIGLLLFAVVAVILATRTNPQPSAPEPPWDPSLPEEEHIKRINQLLIEQAHATGISLEIKDASKWPDWDELKPLETQGESGAHVLVRMISEYPRTLSARRARSCLGKSGTEAAAEFFWGEYERATDPKTRSRSLAMFAGCEAPSVRQRVERLLANARRSGDANTYDSIVGGYTGRMEWWKKRDFLLPDLRHPNPGIAKKAQRRFLYLPPDPSIVDPFIDALADMDLSLEWREGVAMTLLCSTLNDFGLADRVRSAAYDQSRGACDGLLETNPTKWRNWWTNNKSGFDLMKRCAEELAGTSYMKYVALFAVQMRFQPVPPEVLNHVSAIMLDPRESRTPRGMAATVLAHQGDKNVLPLLIRAASYGRADGLSWSVVNHLRRLTGQWPSEVTREEFRECFPNNTEDGTQRGGELAKAMAIRWQEWYEENKDRLVWDKRKRRFVASAADLDLP